MTPLELRRRFKASRARMLREHNERMSLAWHTAAIPATRRFPKLDSLMMRDEPKLVRRQTIAEQIAIAMQWTAATKH